MSIHAKVKKPLKDRTKNNDSDIRSQTAMRSRFEHIHKGENMTYHSNSLK